jgi:hypothetical protein
MGSPINRSFGALSILGDKKETVKLPWISLQDFQSFLKKFCNGTVQLYEIK